MKTMEIYGFAGNMRSLIRNSMTCRMTELTAANDVLGAVNIEREIFQKDTVSPLIFVLENDLIG